MQTAGGSDRTWILHKLKKKGKDFVRHSPDLFPDQVPKSCVPLEVGWDLTAEPLDSVTVACFLSWLTCDVVSSKASLTGLVIGENAFSTCWVSWRLKLPRVG